MIINLTSFQRHFSCAALLAGIFSAASALATPQVATPTFSPAGGAYTSVQSVTITSATNGASIVYTTDGSIPTESGGTITHGTVYTGAIPIASTATLSAIAFGSGEADSSLIVAGYTIAPPTTTTTYNLQPLITTGPVQPPTFGLAPGTYPSAQSVTLSTTTSGATIIYTTDGSTPNQNAGTPTGTGATLTNGGSVSIGSTMILKAIAYSQSSGVSTVTSGIYTITNWPRVIVNVLHDFDGGSPNPIAGLVQASTGNFYGTASGSNSGNSAVFELTSSNLFISFPLNLPNGFEPTAALAQGTDGNFYGTTFSGGSTFTGIGGTGDGTVFKMTPSGTVTTLVSFTGTNGIGPVAALLQGSNGNFYGTTSLGGSNQLGTVFMVTPTGTLTTLVSFAGSNGAAPGGALVLGTDGNFYGTTNLGGSNFASGSNVGDGSVFKMTPAGVLTTLVSFNGINGANPVAGLVLGTDGNFYGTTGEDSIINDGTVFKMTPAGVLTTLATFAGSNGDQPSAGLVQATDGNFYGTTEQGGSGAGTIFRTSAAGGLTSLVSFDSANGNDPGGNLIIGSDGNFYGTTIDGGISNDGVIFQLIVPSGVTSAAAPVFSPAAGTYTSTQTVTITTATSGASIIYTTNGTLPSEHGGSITNGTLYSSPVSIGATTTLEALAFKSSMFDSPTTSGTYTISTPAPTPTPASPASGGGGGGGAPSYWFLGFLAFAGILRWKLRKTQLT